MLSNPNSSPNPTQPTNDRMIIMKTIEEKRRDVEVL